EEPLVGRLGQRHRGRAVQRRPARRAQGGCPGNRGDHRCPPDAVAVSAQKERWLLRWVWAYGATCTCAGSAEKSVGPNSGGKLFVGGTQGPVGWGNGDVAGPRGLCLLEDV